MDVKANYAPIHSKVGFSTLETTCKRASLYNVIKDYGKISFAYTTCSMCHNKYHIRFVHVNN